MMTSSNSIDFCSLFEFSIVNYRYISNSNFLIHVVKTCDRGRFLCFIDDFKGLDNFSNFGMIVIEHECLVNRNPFFR